MTNETPNKLCPLRPRVWIDLSNNCNTTDFGWCEREDCAWWNKDEKQCGILPTIPAVSQIVKYKPFSEYTQKELEEMSQEDMRRLRSEGR